MAPLDQQVIQIATRYHLNQDNLVTLTEQQGMKVRIERELQNTSSLPQLSETAAQNLDLIAKTSLWVCFGKTAQRLICKSRPRKSVVFFTTTWASLADTDARFREGFLEIEELLKNSASKVQSELLLRMLCSSPYIRQFDALLKHLVETLEPLIWRSLDPTKWTTPLPPRVFAQLSRDLMHLPTDDYTKDLLRAELHRRFTWGLPRERIALWEHAIGHGFNDYAQAFEQEAAVDFKRIVDGASSASALSHLLSELLSKNIPRTWGRIERDKRISLINTFLSRASDDEMVEFLGDQENIINYPEACYQALERLQKKISLRA